MFLKGMLISLREFARKPVTIQYPGTQTQG